MSSRNTADRILAVALLISGCTFELAHGEVKRVHAYSSTHLPLSGNLETIDDTVCYFGDTLRIGVRDDELRTPSNVVPQSLGVEAADGKQARVIILAEHVEFAGEFGFHIQGKRNFGTLDPGILIVACNRLTVGPDAEIYVRLQGRGPNGGAVHLYYNHITVASIDRQRFSQPYRRIDHTDFLRFLPSGLGHFLRPIDPRLDSPDSIQRQINGWLEREPPDSTLTFDFDQPVYGRSKGGSRYQLGSAFQGRLVITVRGEHNPDVTLDRHLHAGSASLRSGGIHHGLVNALKVLPEGLIEDWHLALLQSHLTRLKVAEALNKPDEVAQIVQKTKGVLGVDGLQSLHKSKEYRDTVEAFQPFLAGTIAPISVSPIATATGPPESIQGFFVQSLWHSWWGYGALWAVVVLVAAFAVWATLTDDMKAAIVNRCWRRGRSKRGGR